MKYRHGFHAGNFADVHKHVTLLALIAALQRKDKGFLYLETHAGRGRYDLDGADSNQGAEARLGIGVLQAASCHGSAHRRLPGNRGALSRRVRFAVGLSRLTGAGGFRIAPAGSRPLL